MNGIGPVQQRRAIFFAFEGGTGIGHLRRLSCIAKRLQGRFSCLVVTGHRAAANWFIPEECEYVHIPSWDSLLESKARYWGRQPFIALNKSEAVRLRKGILHGVIAAFRPDVIFVDHLPLGAHEELEEVIRNCRFLKYLIIRGILNETEDLRRLVLGGKAHEFVKRHYHKTLVASDQNVFDFSKQYSIPPPIRENLIHTGYVVESVPRDAITRIRNERGVASRVWVVVSAGGGQAGETLVEHCIDLAKRYRSVEFDIVLGPRSSFPWEDRYSTFITEGNMRVHKESPYMPYFHAGADLVISAGGYNSLLETLQGDANILCFPSRKDKRDEQYRHAVSLKKFVDIRVSTEVSDLPGLFQRAVGGIDRRGARDHRAELNFNGAAAIENIVLEDLGVDSEAAGSGVT